MKILYFVDRLLRGGIQTLLLNLVTQIKAERPDTQVDFLLFDDGNEYELEDVFRNLKSCIYKVSWPTFKNVSACMRDLDSFFRSHHDYDLVHAHSSSKVVLPLYYARKYGIKVRIAHSHNTQFQTKNPLVKFIGRLLMYPACYVANYYMACSRTAAKWMFDNFVGSRQPVYILKNGVLLDEYLYNEEIRKVIRRELSISEDEVVIGNIGRFSLQKNHKFLVRIFAAYHRLNPKSKLLLVGTGELYERTVEDVRLLGIENSVMFLGFRNDVSRLYQAFDLFLMPSLYEGLPFVGIEAQASGLPCVFSDTITLELKLLESTIFIPLGIDEKVWATKMDDLLHGSTRHDTSIPLTNAGYNIREEVQRLLNYYDNAIKSV